MLSEMEVQDIDTLEDWEMAEIKYLRRNSGYGKVSAIGIIGNGSKEY